MAQARLASIRSAVGAWSGIEPATTIIRASSQGPGVTASVVEPTIEDATSGAAPRSSRMVGWRAFAPHPAGETGCADVSPGNADTGNAFRWLTDADDDAIGPEGDCGRRALLNPAIFRLLGDVDGRSILDAGCGHRYVSRLLAERGARVVGLEPGDVPHRYAVEAERRRGQDITSLQRDLSAPGDLGGPFDAVVADMVLLDVPDWRQALAACVGALRSGGLLVYSLLHPVWRPGDQAAWRWSDVVEVRDDRNEHEVSGGHAPNFHRRLASYVNETIRLGARSSSWSSRNVGPTRSRSPNTSS